MNAAGADVERRVDRIVQTSNEERITIGWRMHHHFGANIAASTRPIFNDELLPQPLREPLAHQAGGQISPAARCKRRDQPDRLGRIIERQCNARRGRESDSARCQMEKLSAVGKFAARQSKAAFSDNQPMHLHGGTCFARRYASQAQSRRRRRPERPGFTSAALSETIGSSVQLRLDPPFSARPPSLSRKPPSIVALQKFHDVPQCGVRKAVGIRHGASPVT